MLGLDLDIEADLGIDSIKRVEILSALEARMPGLSVVSPEIMGSLKTLGQIATHLARGLGVDSAETPTEAPAPEAPPAPVSEEAGSPPTAVARTVVTPAETPLSRGERVSIPRGRLVYVTDDRTGIADAIVEAFKGYHVDAKRISLDGSVGKSREQLVDAAGLIILPDLRLSGTTGNADRPDDTALDTGFLKNAFAMAKHVAPDLRNSAGEGGALFATVTCMDGAFGLSGRTVAHPVSGGLAGLAKTAAVEWGDVHCRAIDLAPEWAEKRTIAETIVVALLHPDPGGGVEIGLDPKLPTGTVVTPGLQRADSPRIVQEGGDLTGDDVVVVTGGGRGITAASIIALARQSPVAYILLGRSPHPETEPEWLRSLDGETEMKRAIIKHEFAGRPDSPKPVEDSYKRLLANREVARTLTELRKCGASAHYYSTDVRDAAAVAEIIEDVRLAHGPIKGIIHGAGVLEDRLITDKTLDQFDRVFDTKVEGLRALLDATRGDQLKYLVLFSSISARFGNRGQVDYAMANEVLNKMAQQWAIKQPDCHVVAINWGPWDGGMVSTALKKEFSRNRIPLIPMEAGARILAREVAVEGGGPVEVVIGDGIEQWRGDGVVDSAAGQIAPAAASREEHLTQTFRREIDIERHPVLESHIIDKTPVLPFALMTEWLGHGALHENPGLLLQGLDDMRMLQGIKLDGEKPLIRLMAGKARRAESAYEVDVEIRDGLKADGTHMTHYRAKAILSEELSPPPVFDKSQYTVPKGYARSADEIYEEVLFHGAALRGIREVVCCSSAVMVALLSPAPLPEDWMADPLRTRWLGDPLVLDSAFQMASLWCYEERGMVSLPSYNARYRQYRREFPSDGVTAFLAVTDVTERRMRGDFTFLDSEDGVVAQLTGYEAVMDPALMGAFKPELSFR